MKLNEASKDYLEHKNKVLNDKIRKLKKQNEHKFIYDKFIMKINNLFNKLYLHFKGECLNNNDIIVIFYYILYKLLEIERLRFIVNENLILVFLYKKRSYVIDLNMLYHTDKIVLFMDEYVDEYNQSLDFSKVEKDIENINLPFILVSDEHKLYAMKNRIY